MEVYAVYRFIKIQRSLFILFIFLVGSICFSPGTNAWGKTIIDQDLNGDTTWTLDQSPYEVTVPINVGTGVTLTVEAGVVVKFVPGNLGIRVQDGGNLVVNGTAGNPVYFTDFRDDSAGGDTNGDDTQPVAGSWNGIVVDKNNTGNVSLNFAHIRYADNGVYKAYSGSFAMTGCVVTNSESNGVWMSFSEDTNTISECILNSNGNQGIAILDNSGNVTVSGCSVSNNGEKGIWISDLVPGVPKSIIVTNCTISNNGKSGIECDGGADPLIGGSAENRNNIYGNTAFGVNNLSADITVTATYNCWGSLTGPYHSSNEAGKGNPVSDNVDYGNYVPMSGFDGDLDNNDRVDLADAVTAFQVMTGMSPGVFHPEYAVMGIDINGDNRAGLAEAIYILRNVSGL